MTKVSDFFGGSLLKASDLQKPLLLTISGWHTQEVLDDGKPVDKLVIEFEEEQRGLMLNKINASVVEELANTDVLEEWAGTKVVLFKDRTTFGNKIVDCIRVRGPKPDKLAAKAADKFEKEVPVDDAECPF